MRTLQRDFLVILIYILFSSLILLADSHFKMNFLHRAVQFVSQPARSGALGVREFILSPVFVWSDGKNERLKVLEQQNADLLSIIVALQALEEENLEMKRLLDADLPVSWEFVPSRVVGRTTDKLYIMSSYVPLRGDAVITTQEVENSSRGGVFVGRVNLIIGREIEVILPTDVESKIPVLIRQKEGFAQRASGIVVGQGGSIYLDQVLLNEGIEEGDLVVTSGEGGLPPDLFIGTISRVLETPNQTWRQAEVKLTQKLDRLRNVAIVKKY